MRQKESRHNNRMCFQVQMIFASYNSWTVLKINFYDALSGEMTQERLPFYPRSSDHPGLAENIAPDGGSGSDIIVVRL